MSFALSALHHASADEVDIVWIYEILRGPARQVVVAHACAYEILHRAEITGGSRCHQRFDAQVLVVASVVAFVEFVPSTEFRADRIPEKLEQFDAINGGTAVRAAHEAVEIGAYGVALEVSRTRWQVDQAARDMALDQLLDAHRPNPAGWTTFKGRQNVAMVVLRPRCDRPCRPAAMPWSRGSTRHAPCRARAAGTGGIRGPI